MYLNLRVANTFRHHVANRAHMVNSQGKIAIVTEDLSITILWHLLAPRRNNVVVAPNYAVIAQLGGNMVGFSRTSQPKWNKTPPLSQLKPQLITRPFHLQKAPGSSRP